MKAPLTVKLVELPSLTPSGITIGVPTTGGPAMEMVKGDVSRVPAVLVARTMMLENTPPAPVGVPERTPVVELMLRPFGSGLLEGLSA